MPEIRVNKDKFYKYMEENNDMTIPELAHEMGLDRSYVYKILVKSDTPGAKFIAAAVRTLPYSFEELFFFGQCVS